MTTSDTSAAAEPESGGESSAPARSDRGELISAGAAIVLGLLLFASDWYGVAGVPDPSFARPAVSRTEDGWTALTLGRWLILATILVAIGSVVLHITQREHGAKTDTGWIVLLLGSVTSAMLIWRVLISMPAAEVTDQKLGAVLALISALAIALGGWDSVRSGRAAGGAVVHRSSERAPGVSGRIGR